MKIKDLNKKNILELIIKKSNELEITPYEFGKNTEVSDIGARNILNRTSKNPRTKNLMIMLDYIEKKIVGTDIDNFDEVVTVKEPEATYPTHFEKLPIDEKLNIIFKQLKLIIEKLNK